jgi:xanthine/CO dehydrogenase XdhC/CoxF family maturation factor
MNFYKTNFILMHHHKYSLETLEQMMPWEREAYIGMLLTFLQKQQQNN